MDEKDHLQESTLHERLKARLQDICEKGEADGDNRLLCILPLIDDLAPYLAERADLFLLPDRFIMWLLDGIATQQMEGLHMDVALGACPKTESGQYRVRPYTPWVFRGKEDETLKKRRYVIVPKEGEPFVLEAGTPDIPIRMPMEWNNAEGKRMPIPWRPVMPDIIALELPDTGRRVSSRTDEAVKGPFTPTKGTGEIH